MTFIMTHAEIQTVGRNRVFKPLEIRGYYEILIPIRLFGKAMGHKKCIHMELGQQNTDGGHLLDRTGNTRQPNSWA